MDTEKHTYEKHSYYNMIIMFILHQDGITKRERIKKAARS